MTLRDITPENVGAACSLYRSNVLRENQTQFADRHMISKAALSYFERGLSMSLITFLAYVKDGVEDYLPKINEQDLNELIKLNALKREMYIRRPIADLAKPI